MSDAAFKLDRPYEIGPLVFSRALDPGYYWFVIDFGEKVWPVYLRALMQLGMADKFTVHSYEVMQNVQEWVRELGPPVWVAIHVTGNTPIPDIMGQIHTWGADGKFRTPDEMFAFRDYQALRKGAPKYSPGLKGYFESVEDTAKALLWTVAEGTITITDAGFDVLEHALDKSGEAMNRLAEHAGEAAKKLLDPISKPASGLMWGLGALAVGGAAFLLARKRGVE